MRKRNKRLYEKDAKQKLCGRRNCDKPKICFRQRESLAKKKGSLYIFLNCKNLKNKDETTAGADKKGKKNQEGKTAKDAVASIAISTETSKNYTLTDGTIEKYNDGIKKEIMLVWDEGMGEHRYATEQEKLSPDIAKICANKWGSYINKEADSMVRPDCLVDIKTLKPNATLPTYTISVQPTSTDQTGINYPHQANIALKRYQFKQSPCRIPNRAIYKQVSGMRTPPTPAKRRQKLS